jgi:hypothetical protein
VRSRVLWGLTYDTTCLDMKQLWKVQQEPPRGFLPRSCPVICASWLAGCLHTGIVSTT